jgi:bacteriocin-like protein
MEREYQIVTTDLTDDELAAVSGGYTLNNTMISGYAVAVGGGTGGGGTGTGSAGWDLAKSKVC